MTYVMHSVVHFIQFYKLEERCSFAAKTVGCCYSGRPIDISYHFVFLPNMPNFRDIDLKFCYLY